MLDRAWRVTITRRSHPHRFDHPDSTPGTRPPAGKFASFARSPESWQHVVENSFGKNNFGLGISPDMRVRFLIGLRGLGIVVDDQVRASAPARF
jgi:hypothetical protein